MILSFHPLFTADKNIVCAGRPPGSEELGEIRAADAVILPQGCRRSLYEMARNNCPLVFPNFDVRFDYPDKIGQIRLFQNTGVLFPASEIFADSNSFRHRYRRIPEDLPFTFPFVLKFDWGGEGETVHLIESTGQLEEAILTAADFERTGQKGFLIQEFIPARNRILRVIVIGFKFISYWRVQRRNDTFLANLTKGAEIDTESDPELQNKAVDTVRMFCRHTRIDLAGFDILYSSVPGQNDPYFLEINYFFGRRGLGGSEKYYEILIDEIHNWLDRHGLSLQNTS